MSARSRTPRSVAHPTSLLTTFTKEHLSLYLAWSAARNAAFPIPDYIDVDVLAAFLLAQHQGIGRILCVSGYVTSPGDDDVCHEWIQWDNLWFDPSIGRFTFPYFYTKEARRELGARYNEELSPEAFSLYYTKHLQQQQLAIHGLPSVSPLFQRYVVRRTMQPSLDFVQIAHRTSHFSVYLKQITRFLDDLEKD